MMIKWKLWVELISITISLCNWNLHDITTIKESFIFLPFHGTAFKEENAWWLAQSETRGWAVIVLVQLYWLQPIGGCFQGHHLLKFIKLSCKELISTSVFILVCHYFMTVWSLKRIKTGLLHLVPFLLSFPLIFILKMAWHVSCKIFK